MGALSVLTTSPGEPTAAKRAFLNALAARVSKHLQHPEAPASPPTPAWWQEPSGSPLQQAMQAVCVGTWRWTIATGDLFCDELALEAAGLDPRTFDGRVESWMDIIHPDDVPGVRAATEHAFASGQVYSVEYRVRRPDDSIGWVEVRGHVTYSEDRVPVGISGTVWSTTETRMARDSVGLVLRHISDGFLVLDTEWRIVYANVEAEKLFDSYGKLLGRELREALANVNARDLERRFRQAVAVGTPSSWDIPWPATHRWYRMRLVPVPVGLTVYFTDVTENRLREAEEARAEQEAAWRTARVVALTAALAQAITVRDVVDAVADHVLPPFCATGLVVQAVEGDRLQIVGAAGYPKELLEPLHGLNLSAAYPLTERHCTRTPVFVSSADEFADLYPELTDFRESGDKNAWAFLPLVASGHSIGDCVISFDQQRQFTDNERTLLTAISGLVAQALERARLYDGEHARAQALQRALLPRVLPSLPAVTAAARYLPAGEDMDVGGDWYDVIPLSGARAAIVIGDVMGHGPSEAVTMGRLRTAVRTLADLELPPEELLARLNELVCGLGDDSYATCLCAVYDPTTRLCTFACAGHPPPAVVHPDGTVHFPDLAGAPPLGAATPPFDTVEMELPEGSLLVMYTDGLVESADRDLDTGMAQLSKILTTALTPPTGPIRPRLTAKDEEPRTTASPADAALLEGLCDTLTMALAPAQQNISDDAALLIVRTHGLASKDIASWPLPDDAIAASQARRHIRSQLAQWGLDELVMTTELLVSELVGNVVRHAEGPVRLRLLRSETLICEVYDGSQATPRIRRAAETDEGGRGLQLVATLSHRWGARYTATGKCIWTEQLLLTP
ncbi:SpoIIE family protein phosphatase [Streptomyces sp. NPDC054919]